MQKNLASIIIAVYNGEKYLEKSIQSAIDQTYEEVEIIVVDDGSTDNSGEIAQSFDKIKYYKQINQGVASARNLALRKCQGEFVAFLDADDAATPNKLKIQIGQLKNDGSLDLVMGHINNIIAPDCQLPRETIDYYLNREKISFTTMVVRHSSFMKVGLYNTRYIVASDFEWLIRAKEIDLKMKVIPDIVLDRLIHTTNLSLTRAKHKESSRMNAIKESAQRRKINTRKI